MNTSTARPSSPFCAAREQAPPLGSIDEAGQRRPLEPEEPRQLGHPGPAIAQDAERPHLRERQVVVRPDPSQHAHHDERALRERVDEEVELAVVTSCSWRHRS